MPRDSIKQTRWVAGLLLLLLVCWPLTAWAVVAPPSDVYVGDYANVLSEETKQHIITQNEKLAQATGAQIVVVTVDFLDGMTAEDYAHTVFNQWGIGDAEKDNGLLLLLAIGEEDYWAMQGKGLEGTLSSGVLGDYLYDYLEEDFAAGNYDAGVVKTFDALLSWYADYYQLELQGNAVPVKPSGNNAAGDQPYSSKQDGTMLWIVMLLILIVVLLSMNNRRKDRRRRNNRHSNNGYGGFWGTDTRRQSMPRAPRRGIYIPPQPSAPKQSTSSRTKGNSFGGGGSRGGGAGRRSGSVGGFKGFSGGSRGGFGGGSSRGGGAGRRR